MRLVTRLSGYLVLMAALPFAQPSETVSLAASDLVAKGARKSEVAVISEQLRAALMESPRVRLIERSQMEEILKEQGFQQSGCTSDACAVEIGQLLGVKNILIGSLGIAGSYTVLTVRVLNVATGEVVVNKSLRTKGGIDAVLETVVPRIAEDVHEGLFPAKAEATPEPAPKDRSRLHRALLFGGTGALLVGGAVTAVILVNSGEPDDETDKPNTRIVLP